MWPIFTIRSYETLPTHANSGGNTGGVDSNRDVTVGNRGAVETGE